MAADPLERRRRRRRRWTLAAGGSLLLFAVLVSAAWWVARGELETALERARSEGRRSGYALSYEGLAFAGFPLQMQASLERPSLAWQGGTWEGPAAVVGDAWLTDPYRLSLNGSGRHRLTLGPTSLQIDAGDAEAEVELASAGPEALRLQLRRVDLSLADGSAAARLGSLDLAAAPLPPLPDAGSGTDLALDLSGLTLPELLPAPLSPDLQSLSLRATLSGPLLQGPPERVLRAWQRQDGSLSLERFALVWGEVQVEAEGRLGLDPALRPQGELTLQVASLPELLAALAAAGYLDPAAGDYAAMLQGMAQPRAGHSGTWTVLPLVLEDGWAYLNVLFARIPLARVPPLIRD